MMAEKKVWFVTGCSKGMGNVLVSRLLKEGYRVAATSRTREALEGAFGPESERFLPLSMDVADEKDVARAVAEADAKFGRIDVLVNNAGYTHLCTIEEFSTCLHGVSPFLHRTDDTAANGFDADMAEFR